MNRTIAALLVSCSLAAWPIVGAAAPIADATLDISGNTVGVGVGITVAKGTLHYAGKSYPVEMKGVSLPQVGASRITAAGEVFNLRQLADFDGNYAAGSAGATVAGGVTEMTLQNQNGVVIKMHATNQGVDFRLSVDGVSLKVTD
jgi:hypothetical protein